MKGFFAKKFGKLAFFVQKLAVYGLFWPFKPSGNPGLNPSLSCLSCIRVWPNASLDTFIAKKFGKVAFFLVKWPIYGLFWPFFNFTTIWQPCPLVKKVVLKQKKKKQKSEKSSGQARLVHPSFAKWHLSKVTTIWQPCFQVKKGCFQAKKKKKVKRSGRARLVHLSFEKWHFFETFNHLATLFSSQRRHKSSGQARLVHPSFAKWRFPKLSTIWQLCFQAEKAVFKQKKKKRRRRSKKGRKAVDRHFSE